MNQHDRKAWRKGSVYAADFRPLDRNQRAKILFLAEAMDRRTHKPGQHGGFLGRTGLAVLRALITRFHNVKTGRLDPSYEAIAKGVRHRTGRIARFAGRRVNTVILAFGQTRDFSPTYKEDRRACGRNLGLAWHQMAYPAPPPWLNMG